MTDLHNVDLRRAYLKYANLSKADLGGANLDLAEFDGPFSESELFDFPLVNLRGANLIGIKNISKAKGLETAILPMPKWTIKPVSIYPRLARK